MEYSVVIRTLGTAGDKYARLLNALKSQTIPPKNVYVFIPYNYALPKEQMGTEQFIRTEKGMVIQRVVGLEYAAANGNSEYLLVLDDDLEFGSSFVECMIKALVANNGSILIPGITTNLVSGNKLVSKIKKKIISPLLGSRYISLFRSKYKVRIASTAGFIVDEHPNEAECVETQSGPFMCFLCKSSIVSVVDFREELWLEKTKYTLPDDQVFFYKAHCKGLKVLYYNNPSQLPIHLDAGAGSNKNASDNVYAEGHNFLIFWHRFLYQRRVKNKIWLMFCIIYRVFMHMCYYLFLGIARGCKLGNLWAYCRGVKDAYSFIMSSEYKQLPLIDIYSAQSSK